MHIANDKHKNYIPTAYTIYLLKLIVYFIVYGQLWMDEHFLFFIY